MIIGILGGTFDPPHMGHLILAKNALASGMLDEVWFFPCLSHRFGKQPAPFEDRLAMCRLLVNGEKSMRVSDMERTLERPGHTVDLIAALAAAHPDASLRLLAGADIWHERGEWRLFEEIVKTAPPIYVAREGVRSIPEPVLPAPPGISSSELRRVLARGERPLESIPQNVLDYIEAHRLYREVK